MIRAIRLIRQIRVPAGEARIRLKYLEMGCALSAVEGYAVIMCERLLASSCLKASVGQATSSCRQQGHNSIKRDKAGGKPSCLANWGEPLWYKGSDASQKDATTLAARFLGVGSESSP